MDWGEGGGFINDSIAEDPQHAVGSVSVGAGDDRSKLTVNVSVSQVAKLTRPDGGLIIHGKKVPHVILVAYVHDIIDVNNQKIQVLVDDHTGGGPLEVTYVIGDQGTPGEDPSLSMFNDHTTETYGDGSRNIHSVRLGDYIHCVGVCKFSQDKAHVVAWNMRLVEDPNEITMHLMEVCRDSLVLLKTQESGGTLPLVSKDDNKPAGNNNQRQPADDKFGGLATRDKHLLNFLKKKSGGQNDVGIHIDEIVKNFTAFSKAEIVNALTSLSHEGCCWTGDDEDTWCVDAEHLPA